MRRLHYNGSTSDPPADLMPLEHREILARDRQLMMTAKHVKPIFQRLTALHELTSHFQAGLLHSAYVNT